MKHYDKKTNFGIILIVLTILWLFAFQGRSFKVNEETKKISHTRVQ